MLNVYPKYNILAGSEFGNKNSFAKKSKRSEKDSLPQAKIFLSFVKRFSEFAKRIYETRNPNFFNFKLIVVVFSKV